MSQKQIVAIVDQVGRVSIDAQGYTGAACEQATEHLVLALGGNAKKTRKPEYHMPTTENVSGRLTF